MYSFQCAAKNSGCDVSVGIPFAISSNWVLCENYPDIMAAALRPSGEVCIRSLLIEAVRGVCGANLGFDSQLKVEGLVAITVDDQEVTLVNFTETLKETKSTNLASPLREVSPLDNSLEKPSPADYRSPFKRQRGRRRYCSSAGTRMKRTHAEMTHGGWTADRENVEKTSPVHETRTQPDLPQDMESPPPIPNLTLQNDVSLLWADLSENSLCNRHNWMFLHCCRPLRHLAACLVGNSSAVWHLTWKAVWLQIMRRTITTMYIIP